jgi:hypothetical protein
MRAKCQRKEERCDQDADGVIPIKQFKTVTSGELLGIGPGTPANCTCDHHHERYRERKRDEHSDILQT